MSSPPQRIRCRIRLIQLISLLCTALLLTNASSPHPQPLSRIHHPSQITHRTIPKRTLPHHHPHKRSHYSSSKLLSTDALVLNLKLPSIESITRKTGGHGDGDGEVFIHLEPNLDLLHPNAQILFSGSGSESKSDSRNKNKNERIKHSDIRVYHGDVILSPFRSEERYLEDLAGGVVGSHGLTGKGVRGWAAFSVMSAPGDELDGNNDGDYYGERDLVVEGTFNVDGRMYHVMPRERWDRVRKVGEPLADEGLNGRIVVFSDGDDVDVQEESSPLNGNQHQHQHQYETGCSHDSLWFNVNSTFNPASTSSSVQKQRHHPHHKSLPGSSASLWSLWNIEPLQDVADYMDVPSTSSRNVKRDDIVGGSSGTNYIGSIGSTRGCPTTQKIIYMGVAADCGYVAAYNGEQGARTQIINNFNSISALYRQTFNIAVGILELKVMPEACPTTASSSEPWNLACDSTPSQDLNARLSLFSQWRATQTQSQAGLYHLYSSCPTNSEVGVAWLGVLCQRTASTQGGQTVSGTGVSTGPLRTEWSLSAHEIGHNFGAIHDCISGCSLSGQCCPLSTSACDASGRYIMNPTTSASEINFSPCSIGNICSSLGGGVDTSCLAEPGTETAISLQECGNGIVEAGEDCDPGGNSTACCNAQTCKFINNAVCDPASSSCCTSSCTFAPSTQVCRPAIDQACDIAETCTGNSSSCPADQTRADGTSCGSNGLACASGTCTSLSLQCQNAGATLNLTTACNARDDRSCMVSCQTPGGSSLSCLVLQVPLIDGSPCGLGGRCQNSTCQSGSVGSQIGSWFTQNKNISIPVTVCGGLAILAFLIAMISCCCRRARGPKGNTLKPRKQNGFVGVTPGMTPVPPPPMRQSRHSQRPSQSSNQNRTSQPPPWNTTAPLNNDVGYQSYPAAPPLPPRAHQQSQQYGGYYEPHWEPQPDYPQQHGGGGNGAPPGGYNPYRYN